MAHPDPPPNRPNRSKRKRDPLDEQAELQQQVRFKSERKLKARREGDRSIWYGLGFSGLVGWSVTLPTLLGVALGIWIDTRHDTDYSWTLMLMLLGVLIGCLNAWYWIQQESRDD